MTKYILTSIIVILLTFSQSLTILQSFILGLELFLLLFVLERVGAKFVFLELLALIAVTQWLFAPAVLQWMGLRMNVPFETYFEYAVPGTLLFLFGMIYPLFRYKKWDGRIDHIFNGISEYFARRKGVALTLMVIGLPFWIFQNSVPGGLSFIFHLCSYLFFIGLCAQLFTTSVYKWILLAAGILVLIMTTLLNGMIGTVIFWLIILGVVIGCKEKLQVPFLMKLGSLVLVLWAIAILQVVKTAYREETWLIDSSANSSRIDREIRQDPGLFVDLIGEQITEPSRLLEPGAQLGLINRLNQGALVSMSMDYVPDRRPHAGGEVTLMNTLTAFVPRLLWPSKPVVGQQDYFEEYTGIRLGKYHSSTLGPIGDAYVDFGQWGILFLGFMGLLIGKMYTGFVTLSTKRPTMFLWFVAIYFTSITVTEISVASYINALFKFIIFIGAMRILLKSFLRISL